MKTWTISLIFSLLVGMGMCGQAAAALPKLILLTQSMGYEHDVVKHRPGKLSIVQQVFTDIADTKLFELEMLEDAAALTPEKMKQASVIVFYTTGPLPLDVKALDQWIQAGGGFMTTHTGTDTLHDNPDYLKIIGAEFDGHPWTAKETVTMKLDDPDHSAVSMFDPHYTLQEEVYQYKNFDPSAVRVLMSLDMERTKLKLPEHVPVVWCKEYGKGRVFHTELGHNMKVWESDVYQQHLAAAVKWVMGKGEGSATPNPEVSKQEEEIAKRAAKDAPPVPPAPAEQPKPAAKKPVSILTGKAPKGIKIAAGFVMTPFVSAPDITSPASIAVTPDGKVFVGEDAYNSKSGRELGLSDIKLCVDTDGDGKADKITVFADKINSPQGMCYAGGTLYVSHAPLLTALTDTDGDGVADVREDLVTGFGPVPNDLVHHVPSGVCMGIDGWLYISVGDKGIEHAVGKDGRQIHLHGGGVVRVRPDGTGLQFFCTGTRNIFDVAIDPLMNVFTRDNTNDGGGWQSRLSLMQRDAIYGYPNLFVNFGDEIVQPLADYGSGAATGSLYVMEPQWPKEFNENLFTCDWARRIIYRHKLKANGASFDPDQKEFATGLNPTHIEMDGMSRMYCADWARRNWNVISDKEGVVYLIQAEGYDAKAVEPWPDLRKMDAAGLVGQLAHASMVRRREAQQELLRRGDGAELDQLLAGAVENAQGPLYGRVAALLTYSQLKGKESHPAVVKWIADPVLREFALRALVDRDGDLVGVDPKLFVDALTDAEPRVREQAAIGLGHLGDASAVETLVPLVADKDANVREAAQQAMRLLNNPEMCIAAIEGTQNSEIITGVLRVLRDQHDVKTVAAMVGLLGRDHRMIVKQESVRTLERLYGVEAPWDGTWWDARPVTHGPNFKSARWEGSSDVGNLLIALAGDSDRGLAKSAIAAIGLAGAIEAVPMLEKWVNEKEEFSAEAADALIQMSLPESAAALEKIVSSDKFSDALRLRGVDSIAGIEAQFASASLARLVGQMDGSVQANQTSQILDKLCDALATHAAVDKSMNGLVNLFQHANHPAAREAAAASLLQSDGQTVKDRVAAFWKDGSPADMTVLLMAARRVPLDQLKPYQSRINEIFKSSDGDLRHAVIMAMGHIGDADSVNALLAISNKTRDALSVAESLAQVPPVSADEGVLAKIAKVLADGSRRFARATDRDTYTTIRTAAEQYMADKRLTSEEVEKLSASLKRQDVIYSYLRTDPIDALSPEKAFDLVCAPEKQAGGPFDAFTVDGKTIAWKPMEVSDPQGKGTLELPKGKLIYLTATVDAPAACTGFLSCGSDDGVQVWLNGERVISRGSVGEEIVAKVKVAAGKNVLLFKLNSLSVKSNIAARLRWRPADFDPDQIVDLMADMPADLEKGRTMFTTLGCVRCHTLDAKEPQKGPFLGDVGTKYDLKYIAESILRPSAKIAQGFSTMRVIYTDEKGKNQSEVLGFMTSESPQEMRVRDINGREFRVNMNLLVSRERQPGSIMPEGLTDATSIEDFHSLLSYLQSLKAKN